MSKKPGTNIENDELFARIYYYRSNGYTDVEILKGLAAIAELEISGMLTVKSIAATTKTNFTTQSKEELYEKTN